MGVYPSTTEVVSSPVSFFGANDTGSVASIYFSNGTYMDIAKIEGGSAFKQTMRNARMDDTIAGKSDQSISPIYIHDQLQTVISSMNEQPLEYFPGYKARFSYLWEPIVEHMRSWLSQREPANGLAHMFAALKAATESFLEHPISIVDMTVPWQLLDSDVEPFRNMQIVAKRITGLQSYQSAQIAGQRAADFYGKPSTCEGDYPLADQQDLVLTVDYSRAALTMMLFHEFCAFYDQRRSFHSSQLGVEGLRHCHDTRGAQACRTDLKSAIQQVSRRPDPDSDPNFPKGIGRIVIIGESAADPLLSEVLHEVLREIGSTQVIDTPSSSSIVPRTEPLFVASRAIAKWNWDIKYQEQ